MEREEVNPDDVFDFFVVNDDPRTRRLTVDEGVRIRNLSGGGPDLAESDLEDLSFHLPRPDTGFWVEVQSDEIAAIEEQYIP